MFDRAVNYVPVASSARGSTAFKTGIMWDMSGGGSEYSNATRQNLVWAVKVNASIADQYGIYDYLGQVPYTLSIYQPGNDLVAVYAEVQ